MSRTIRIKNNPRIGDNYRLDNRGLGRNSSYSFQYVGGELLGKDENYLYLVAVEDTRTSAIWREKRWMHADGRAYYKYGGKVKQWVHKLFNKIDRSHAKTQLHKLV